MAQKYSFNDYSKDGMARAISRSMPISFKQSIEICNYIRNKRINYAKDTLTKVIDGKSTIPFKRFNSDVGHKKIGAAGRYPKKASKEILDLINQVEANAQFKGLNTANLVITHINANKAPTTIRYGRKRSRKAKRTSIEIVVKEKAAKKEAVTKDKKTEPKKDAGKKEAKVTPKKETTAKKTVETKKPIEKEAKKIQGKGKAPEKKAAAQSQEKEEPKKEAAKENKK